MNRLMIYMLCLSTVLWTAGDRSFASNLDAEPEGTRTITIHLKNEVPNLRKDVPRDEINEWYKVLVRGELNLSDQSPYILPVKDNTGHSVNLSYNIQVALTVLGESNYSKVIVSDLPRANKTMTWKFDVPESVSLDRASIDIQAYGAAALIVKDGQVIPDGDFRYISLSSTWHLLKAGTTGWLVNNTLYGHFMTSPPVAHTYKVLFGHGMKYFK